MGNRFELVSPYSPAGDQPQAIASLIEGFESGLAHQTLLGVTGSGKTYTIANVIQAVQKPTLVMAPNKTLAAQLYGEFKAFFPHNAVEYFVSYYDYYQPEAYVPSSDTFIEKDSSINEHIEQMRLSATKALLERRDAIIVCTVSAIYGLGDPNEYFRMVLHMVRGERIDQRELIRRLTEMQYTRNDIELRRGTYRVRGEVIDVHPAESEMRGAAHRAVRRRDREASRCSIRSPARPCASCRATRSTRSRTTSPRAAPCWTRSRRSRSSCASGWSSCTRRTSWSRRSAWRSAPSSTWR